MYTYVYMYASEYNLLLLLLITSFSLHPLDASIHSLLVKKLPSSSSSPHPKFQTLNSKP